MDHINVYCINNSELSEFEASSKGYRSDIFVTITGEIFHINVYDIVRLQQDFETELDSYGFFSIEPNIIIVKEVTIKNIKLTIERLHKQKFFEYLKPINNDTLDFKNLVEL